VKAPKEQRNQKLREIVNQDSWIIEGVYRGWIEPSFSVADKIIVLMPPLSVQEERIWMRYEERRSGAVPSKKRETLEGIKILLEWNKNYNLNSLPHFISNCNYTEKIITVDNNMDILGFF
jgi:cytidylate kinase